MGKYMELYCMLQEQQILLNIKKQILEVLPEAAIYLFGSRANGKPTAESDWDILVISNKEAVSPQIKKAVHDRVFPLSVSIGSFINLLIVTKNDWQQNPSYYSLKKSIGENSVAL